MTLLRHPQTKHELKTNDESVAFWVSAGYEAAEKPKAPAKAAPAKKSSK